MRRSLGLVLVAVAVASAAYLGAVAAALAAAPASPLERGLEARGLDVSRALGSSLPDLKSSPGPVALVALVAPADVPAAERDALRAHVEAGGVLWVLSPYPSERALWDGAPLARAFPGFLYGANGSAPVLALEDQGTLSSLGFLALRTGADDTAAGGPYRPLLSADERAFRDTNGNRRLDGGEPAGPFVVAAEAAVGKGRVVVVGVEDAALVPESLATALSRGLPEGRVVVIDGAAPGAWAGPGLRVLALAGLPAGSLLAAALLLVAAAALLLLLLGRGDDAAREREEPALRLSDSYLARLRERGRPEDLRLLQSIEGDTAP